jgi:pimeloyl-ACP methyl ester carboxylesterase
VSSGLPLVLLPGMNCSGRLWRPVADRLAGPGVEVVDAALEGADLATCVGRLLDRLPGRFALAGLSLGGIVAMALHRTAPERVAGLCLVATSPLPPTDVQRESWAATVARIRRGTTAREVQEELIPVLLRADAVAPLRETTLLMADEVGSDRLAEQLRLQATRVDERDALRTVAVPTTVVAGEVDLLCPVERHQLIHELVGEGSELVVLRDTGHLAPLERPAEVAGAMSRWLARVAGEG